MGFFTLPATKMGLCTEPCGRTTFRLERGFVGFHASWWEGKTSGYRDEPAGVGQKKEGRSSNTVCPNPTELRQGSFEQPGWASSISFCIIVLFWVPCCFVTEFLRPPDQSSRHRFKPHHASLASSGFRTETAALCLQ